MWLDIILEIVKVNLKSKIKMDKLTKFNGSFLNENQIEANLSLMLE